MPDNNKTTYNNNYVEVSCAGKKFAINFGPYGILTIGSSETDTFNTSEFVDGIKKKHIEIFVGKNGKAYVTAKKGTYIDNTAITNYSVKYNKPIIIKNKDEVVLSATLRCVDQQEETSEPKEIEKKETVKPTSVDTTTYNAPKQYTSVPFGNAERYCARCGSYVSASNTKCPYCHKTVKPGKIFSGLRYDRFNEGNKEVKIECILNAVFNFFTLSIALPLIVLLLIFSLITEVSSFLLICFIALITLNQIIFRLPRKFKSKNIQKVYQIRAERIYEDSNLIVSPNFIYNKFTDEIVAIKLNEIIGAHAYSQTPGSLLQNFNKIGIVIIDKSGTKIKLITNQAVRSSDDRYSRQKTLDGIAKICPNAKTGWKSNVYNESLENAKIKED